MRSTLFLLPHELLGLPVFGWGWALIVVLLLALGRAAIDLKNGRGVNEVQGSLPVTAVLLAAIVFVFPKLELEFRGEPVGIPIRGYGVMLLAAVVSGLSLAIYRGRAYGIKADTLVSLAFWLFCGGIAGARLFYVVQKWDEFERPTIPATIFEILKFTEGGLVVFGSLIGALVAMSIFAIVRKLSALALADLVMPSFLIGQALGRIGCLLNGCCYGGVCDQPLPTIRFPMGSPAYVHQLVDGSLIGASLRTSDAGTPDAKTAVEKIDRGGIAKKLGMEAGDPVQRWEALKADDGSIGDPTAPPKIAWQGTVRNRMLELDPAQLPSSSLPVHPAQLYAAIDAALLCAFLWWLYPIASRDGVITGVALIMHAISRFLLELIRSDEGGQFGTSFTISQWICLLLLIGGAAMLLFCYARPAGRAFRLIGGA